MARSREKGSLKSGEVAGDLTDAATEKAIGEKDDLSAEMDELIMVIDEVNVTGITSEVVGVKRYVSGLGLSLASHLAIILGFAPEHPEVNRYVSALRSEGCDTPDDFDGR